ncbi:MAG: hypothetical protein K5790_04610 [Nitrosopumilus sp.]|uniref:hypothetical protein n=1 Tax=Nitrosopumilus sp. TaxID=2024843 RepID=UPI00247B5808|nr:hypothetical protein [Nitrosopumilus sp.]MCV0392561.1 hypothetical protein [Nitrosopumilus sp.]
MKSLSFCIDSSIAVKVPLAHPPEKTLVGLAYCKAYALSLKIMHVNRINIIKKTANVR